MKDMTIDWNNPNIPEWANAVISNDKDLLFYVTQWGGVSPLRVLVGDSSGEELHYADMNEPHCWNLVSLRPIAHVNNHPKVATEQFLYILPPQVGETVMYAFTGMDWDIATEVEEPLCWWECTVTYRIEDQGVVAICKTVGGDVEQYLDTTCVVFKEIVLTDEQKAQQDKEKAIADILEDVYDIWWADDKTLAERLYDRGYVKSSPV